MNAYLASFLADATKAYESGIGFAHNTYIEYKDEDMMEGAFDFPLTTMVEENVSLKDVKADLIGAVAIVRKVHLEDLLDELQLEGKLDDDEIDELVDISRRSETFNEAINEVRETFDCVE